MANFYRICVVIEAESQFNAEILMDSMIMEQKQSGIWFFDGAEMTNNAVLQFFDKTKKEMNK